MLENNVLIQERIYELAMYVSESVASALFPTTKFKMCKYQTHYHSFVVPNVLSQRSQSYLTQANV